MSSIRISDISNDFNISNIKQNGNYIAVDSQENGTQKVGINSIFELITNNIQTEIENLEKRINEMNQDIPSQLLDLKNNMYYRSAESHMDSTSKFGDYQRFRYGYDKDDESGSRSDKLTLKFQHETMVGINILYRSTAASTTEDKKYYFEIIEQNDTGLDTSEHIVDRVIMSDTVAHSYTKWIKVYSGSQIYIDLYNKASTASGTILVNSIFQTFDIKALMYSNTPLGGWKTLKNTLKLNYQNIATPAFIPEEDGYAIFSGRPGFRGKDTETYWDGSTYSTYHSFYTYNNATNTVLYEYKEDTKNPGSYTNTVKTKHVVKIIPTYEYAHNISSITKTYEGTTDLTRYRVYAPIDGSTLNYKKADLSAIIFYGQYYMLPEGISKDEISVYGSTGRYRWGSVNINGFYSDSRVQLSNYNENIYNMMQNDDGMYYLIASEILEDGSISPIMESCIKATSGNYYDIGPIKVYKDKKYAILYKYVGQMTINDKLNIYTISLSSSQN